MRYATDAQKMQVVEVGVDMGLEVGLEVNADGCCYWLDAAADDDSDDDSRLWGLSKQVGRCCCISQGKRLFMCCMP